MSKNEKTFPVCLAVAATFLSVTCGTSQPTAQDTAKNGIFPEMKNFEAFKSIEARDQTILTEQQFADWRQRTDYSLNDIVWQVPSPWSMLGKDPLKGAFLPGREALRQPVALTASRDEGESAAVFLVNAANKTQDVTLRLDGFKDSLGNAVDTIDGQLSVAGAVWTRRWGQTLRPLFAADNVPSAAILEKNLVNAATIKDFPTLHLPSRGSALLWITVRTKNTAPGNYTSTLKGGPQDIPVRLKVVPLTMPYPDVWMRFWGNIPSSQRTSLPAPALETEIQYMRELGSAVWKSWPENGNYAAIAREQAKVQGGRRTYFITELSPSIKSRGFSSQLDPAKFDDEFKREVRTLVQRRVEQAKALGLSYDEWSIELWDEPTVRNMAAWAGIARIIKDTNPQVRIYMNPLFWTREGTNPAGFVTDERQIEHLKGWYNELVDISVPILGQVNAQRYPQANAQFYDHQPRMVRALFIHPNPGRMLSWEAFRRGYNGWGSYAYYAPRQDPWNDFDHREFDYQIVYPGPKRVIPTIESESMRESFEDYRLLSLLKQQGKEETLSEILGLYQGTMIKISEEESVEERQKRGLDVGEKLPLLREMALKAASETR
jgi:hypothetical protein